MTIANTKKICKSNSVSHRIDVVSPEFLPVVWPQIIQLLQESLDQFTPQDAVYYSVFEGLAKLWVIHSNWIDGFVITGTSNKIGVITHCGGKNIKKWIHLLDVIESDFKEQGCLRWQMAGRKGWKKLIKFDDECHLFTKVL